MQGTQEIPEINVNIALVMIHTQLARVNISFPIAVCPSHCQENLLGPSGSAPPSAQSRLDEMNKMYPNATIAPVIELHPQAKLVAVVSLAGTNGIVHRVREPCRRPLIQRLRVLLLTQTALE